MTVQVNYLDGDVRNAFICGKGTDFPQKNQKDAQMNLRVLPSASMFQIQRNMQKANFSGGMYVIEV